MQCSSCGNFLPPTAAYCPDCGTATPYAASPAGTPPYGLPTYDASQQVSPPPATYDPSFDASLQASPPPSPSLYDASPQASSTPSTDYGAPPYGSSEPVYGTFNPYEVSVPPPPPPPPSPFYPPPRRKGRPGLLIGAVLLVLILIGGGVFAFFSLAVKNTGTHVGTTTTRSTPGTTTVENTSYGSYKGVLAFSDPLQDNSKGYNWHEGSDSNGSCTFTGEGYQVQSQKGGYFYPCTAGNTDFSNFVFEVQLKIVQGDCGAVLFRVDSSITNFYFYRVCQDGTTALFMYINNNGSTLISSHASSAVHTGLNQTNLVAIAARGSSFVMYINHQQTDSASDSTYSHGEISLVVDGYPHNHPTEAIYSNAKLWTL